VSPRCKRGLLLLLLLLLQVPGDGRELVVMLPDAVKVSAEDGRRVEAVDISDFINNLPGGSSTAAFRSDDASGSTSQAANIQVRHNACIQLP
jgi:predicted ABC-class ATPase